MKNIIKLIFFLFFSFFTLSLADENKIIQRIKENYNGQKTISFDLELNIFWKIREKHENKFGSVLISSNDRFRVELGNILWISNGKTLWEYDKSISQVVIRNFSEVNNFLPPSQLIQKYCSKYSFKVTNSQNESILEWKADSLIKNYDLTYIKIIADNKDALIKKLFLIDKNGNETTYTFKNYKINTNISSSQFTFDVPKGVRVIDYRE